MGKKTSKNKQKVQEETQNLKDRNQNEENNLKKEEENKPEIPDFEFMPTPIESTFMQIKENIDLPLCCLFTALLMVLFVVFYKFEKEAREHEMMNARG